MTHSLHRAGTREELQNDWVILCVPTSGVNSENSKPKMKHFFEICKVNNAVTIGEGHVGNDIMAGFDYEAFYDSLHDNCVCGQATFNTEEDVANVIRQLKEVDIGLSIVISGLIDRVNHICRQVGTHHHTVTNSYGIWGHTEKLPPPNVLNIVTMCGHGLVSSDLVYDKVEKIKKGHCTAKEAAWDMAKDCVCGIFNPDRAERLLQAMANNGSV